MSDGEDGFENLVEGDGFLDEEEKAAQEARERRLKRKRRLESISTGVENNQESMKIDAPAAAGPEPISTDVLATPESAEERVITDEKKAGGEVIEFDMFSSSTSPPISKDMINARKPELDINAGNVDQQQDWDDVEGYYKASIGKPDKTKFFALLTVHDFSHICILGETISLEVAKSCTVTFRVSAVVGKGVFSNVVKCITESSNSSTHLPPQVALKCIRHNSTMAQAALKEIRFLQRFSGSPGIIPLLLPTDSVPLEFRGKTFRF